MDASFFPRKLTPIFGVTLSHITTFRNSPSLIMYDLINIKLYICSTASFSTFDKSVIGSSLPVLCFDTPSGDHYIS